MRILLVAHRVRPTDGRDRYALELARRLDRTCQVHIVATEVSGDLPPGVRIHRVNSPAWPTLLAAPTFRAAAAPFMNCELFDVVHAVDGTLPGASVVTATFCHAAWRAAGGPQGPYQRLLARQAIRDERRAYGHRNLRAVIAVSSRIGEEVQLHYGPLRAPVTVIPGAEDLETFAPPDEPRGTPAARAAMGRAARGAVEGLTWESVAERTLEVYVQVVEAAAATA